MTEQESLQLHERMMELERNLVRAALSLGALVKVLIESGVITAEHLQTVSEQMDGEIAQDMSKKLQEQLEEDLKRAHESRTAEQDPGGDGEEAPPPSDPTA